MLPYGKQTIDASDIEAVVEVLKSAWLTTGPKVDEFEQKLSALTGAQSAVAVNSGTAALHCAMSAAGIEKGDEVIVPAITFAASANAAAYLGAEPVFADVDSDTLLINPSDVISKITARTRAIVSMDYAGQPCDYVALRKIADDYDLTLISDSCHSLGAERDGSMVGSLTDFTCFSFHPIKPITTGEGGAVVTNNPLAAEKMRSFRNHGITTDFRQREKTAAHRYDMATLGYNYRITDLQCALGISQLDKLSRFQRRRADIARYYDTLLSDVDGIAPLSVLPDVNHAYHLYVVKLNHRAGVSRDHVFTELRQRGIGANVHYRPVYQHSWYQQRFGDQEGCCPIAEQAYQQILSLPIFPGMEAIDVRRVVGELKSIISSISRIEKAA